MSAKPRGDEARAYTRKFAAMPEPARFSAIETLRNGRRIEIRAVRPEDREGLLAAVARVGGETLYRRFFSIKRYFTDEETSFYLNVDFVDHVALAAIAEEGGGPAIIGGGRYVVLEPGRAEAAFAIVDQYQGQGIGGALMRHLAAIAREADLRELVAEALPRQRSNARRLQEVRLASEREARIRDGARPP